MKVILISEPLPPASQYLALLSWQIRQSFSSENLLIASLNRNVQASKNDEHLFGSQFKEQPLLFGIRERAYRPRFLNPRVNFIWPLVFEAFRRWAVVPFLKRKVLKLAFDNQAPYIWVVLRGQTSIWLCESLIRSSKIPIRVQVLSYPQLNAQRNRLDRFSRKVLAKSFKYCLKNAEHLALPSQRALVLAPRKVGEKKTQIILAPVGPTLVSKNVEKTKIVVGVAGQTCTTDSFNNLVRTLDSEGWQIDGRSVEIHSWGLYKSHLERSGIIYHEVGRDEAKIIKALNQSDLIYCGVWFDANIREGVEVELPRRLLLGLASGVPTILHGPLYSAGASLLQESNSGLVCSTNSPEIILYYLRSIVYDGHLRQSLVDNGLKTIKTFFSEDHLKVEARLFNFVSKQNEHPAN